MAGKVPFLQPQILEIHRPWKTLPILLLLKLPMGGEKVNKRKQYVFKGGKKSKVPRVRLMEFDAGFNFNEESCQ